MLNRMERYCKEPLVTKNLVLSVFPGIDILGRAFEEEGFCVVRGPDVLWGGDIRAFHPPAGVFEGVIGGPPYQEFSPLVNLMKAKGVKPRHPNLIPEFVRVVSEAKPSFFVMENVKPAPVPKVSGYNTHSFILCPTWLGEEQRRQRRISFGVCDGDAVDLRHWIEYVALELSETENAVFQGSPDNSDEAKQLGGHGPLRYHGAVTASDGGSSVKMERYRAITEMCRLQGLPEDFFGKDSPFRMDAKRQLIGNAVALPVGRAIARAIRMAPTV